MPPTLTKIKETCLYVGDLVRTKYFYETLLGMKVIHYKEDRHLFIRIGTDVLLFFNPEVTKTDQEMPQHEGYGRQHIAFECPLEEYESWKAHIKSLSIPIEQEIIWPKGGKSFYFRDPDGLCLEIVEPGIWGF